MIVLVTLCGLVLTAFLLFNKGEKPFSNPKNLQFERLQSSYLIVYCLATFSDWLQGPYVYKLYSYYGYEEEDIAILYIAGFASSFLFGSVVGHVADKYGRKMLCIAFGFFYSTCCLTKISPQFYVLLFGRVLGGISTSILFSTFDAWYVNEHINHFNFSKDWLNFTFSKASFYTGFLAILAGIISQIGAESLGLGPVVPFLLAIPFLLMTSFLVWKTWTEHPPRPHSCVNQSFMAPLYFILFKDRILLILGLIQSMFEAVMYTFIFSWTPIISDLNPPLGLVFACFMLALMIGSKIYELLLSDRLPPQCILVLTSALSFISLCTVTMMITCIIYTNQNSSLSLDTRTPLIQVCFLCFVIYELSIGLYFPVLGYLKSTVIPEEYRASIANWFRVPMNTFTCISLTLNQVIKYDVKEFSTTTIVFKKFHLIFILCSVLLLLTVSGSVIFKEKYNKRFSKEVSFNEVNDVKVNEIIKENPNPS